MRGSAWYRKVRGARHAKQSGCVTPFVCQHTDRLCTSSVRAGALYFLPPGLTGLLWEQGGTPAWMSSPKTGKFVRWLVVSKTVDHTTSKRHFLQSVKFCSDKNSDLLLLFHPNFKEMLCCCVSGNFCLLTKTPEWRIIRNKSFKKKTWTQERWESVRASGQKGLLSRDGGWQELFDICCFLDYSSNKLKTAKMRKHCSIFLVHASLAQKCMFIKK